MKKEFRVKTPEIGKGKYNNKLYNCTSIHVPKTGGSSICHTLKLRNNHWTAKYHQEVSPSWNTRFKFAFIRNPWERAISWFMSLPIRTESNFERWVLNGMDPKWKYDCGYPRMMYQEDWIEIDGRLAVDFLGRFENFEEDFFVLCDKLGVLEKKKNIKLSHIHKRDMEDSPNFLKSKWRPFKGYREDYRKFWTREMVHVTEPVFGPFAGKYGYEF